MPLARLASSHSSNPDSTIPSDVRCSFAASTARSLAYSFLACPLCPRTQVHWTSCSRELASSAFQSSRFSIGPSFRFHPRAAQPGTHSRMPLTRYWESDTISTRSRAPFLARSCSAAMAPPNAMRLLVVAGELM